MKHARSHHRKAVGLTLRRLRQGGSLSLDDVESLTREQGSVVVTRSHLSRVETGQADIALPRFLGLMRALGHTPAKAIEEIEARVSGQPLTAGDMGRAVSRLVQERDPARAARLLRVAFARRSEKWPEELVAAWVVCEARSGQWLGAERAVRAGVAASAREGLLIQAIVALGCGQARLAQAVATTLASTPSKSTQRAEQNPSAGLAGCGSRTARLAGLLLAASTLELEQADEAARIAGRFGALGADETVVADEAQRSGALVVAGEAYRRNRQLRAAARAIERACELSSPPLVRAEAWMARARICADLRRPGAGLRALRRAARLARDKGALARLAEIHRHAGVLHRIDGDRSAAASAERSRRSLCRRLAGESAAHPASLAPLLFELAITVLGLDPLSKP